jgi:hypothetical protein
MFDLCLLLINIADVAFNYSIGKEPHESIMPSSQRIILVTMFRGFRGLRIFKLARY